MAPPSARSLATGWGRRLTGAAPRGEERTVSALRKKAEGWDVSIQSRGIKASATGAADLARFSSARDDL